MATLFERFHIFMNGPRGPVQPTVPDELLPPPPPPLPVPRGFDEVSIHLRDFVKERIKDGLIKKKEIWRWGQSIGKLILDGANMACEVVEANIDDKARSIDLKNMAEGLAEARVEYLKLHTENDKSGLGTASISEILDEVERLVKLEKKGS